MTHDVEHPNRSPRAVVPNLFCRLPFSQENILEPTFTFNDICKDDKICCFQTNSMFNITRCLCTNNSL